MKNTDNAKKSGKVNMIANMAKVGPVPSQTADALIYDLPPAESTVALPVATESDLPKAKVPFTNQLTPETFLRLKQFECWGGMEIQDILEEALTAFFNGKPEADRELPAKAKDRLRKKLPNLK
jgi:hypothetical protein